MNFAVKVMAIAASLAIVAAAAAAVKGDAVSSARGDLPAKDESRMSFADVTNDSDDFGGALVQLAQAARPAPAAAEHGPLDSPPEPPRGMFGPAEQDFSAPEPAHPDFAQFAEPQPPFPQFGEPRPPFPRFAGPRPPFAPFMLAGPLPPDRNGCEERLNRASAIAGYVKSKLQLQGNQRDLWRKIEDAAAPEVDKMRAACALLPAEPGARPSLPRILEAAEQQLTAHAGFIHAIRPPLMALYATLSDEQRAALEPHPPGAL